MKHLTDTHPSADIVQCELLRQASIAQRLTMMRSMTRIAVHGSRRACEQAHPELTLHELELLFVELNYGRDLADKVRRHTMS